jgi:hypothetical protein
LIEQYRFATYRTRADIHQGRIDRLHTRNRYRWQHRGKYEGATR